MRSLWSSIERRAARHLLTVIASAVCADFARPSAQDATAGLAIRLRVELAEHALRDLRVWEELPLSVTIENVGEAGGVPASEYLRNGSYGGATLYARVRNLAAPTAGEADFQLNADGQSVCCCPGGIQLLEHGKVVRYEGSVCVGLDLIVTDSGTYRNVLMSAFPTAGRYSVRVVYTWAGKSAASAPIEIDVLPVPPEAADALAYLRDMGSAGWSIYRQGRMGREPARLASIQHLATAFQSNAYSDLACLALAGHQVGVAWSATEANADVRIAHLREGLAYLDRISSPRFSRRDACETLRGRINERLARELRPRRRR